MTSIMTAIILEYCFILKTYKQRNEIERHSLSLKRYK